MKDDIDKPTPQDETSEPAPTADTMEAMEETTVMPAADPIETDEEEGIADSPSLDQPTEEQRGGGGRRKRLAACAAALAVAALVAGGAWYASTSAKTTEPVPTTQAEAPKKEKRDTQRAPESQKREVTSAIDTEAATAIVNDMGLPKTSRVKVDAADRRVVVVEEAELVDKLVAERAFDRAYEMAGLVEESQAESVTWVLDNGKGAEAAVTVAVEDGRDESKAPTDVAGKLATAEGYALSEGAYAPVKDVVKEPTAGETPVSTSGDELVEPAKKAEESKADTSAPSNRTPSDSQQEGSQQGSSASRTPSSSGTSMTRDTNSSSSSSSGSSSSSSAPAEPAKRWVEEQGHWEDVYESQEVKTGTRWVVDQEAWDEDVYETRSYWAFSDGYTTESEEDGRNYMYQKKIEGNPVTGGVVTDQVYAGTIHHDEVGHYEDVYETQQVKTGSNWVVDVPGHWE